MLKIESPVILPVLFPGLTWKMPVNGVKEVFLSFDDGPTDELTPWILEVLDRHKIKATFFCVGENVKNHPDLYQQIIEEGHQVGNHTYHHLKGWNTSNKGYYEDIKKADDLIASPLFRPPHGKIKPSQIAHVKKEYRIVMWDVLTRDFDQSIEPWQCMENVKKFSQPGSIIVFHDSLKAEKNLRYTLPRAINYLEGEGYLFRLIEGTDAG